jgi:hypothetical protein
MADSSTASGLIYSNAVTSAMLAPAGNTIQRPNPATPGQFRYNSQTGKFEFATGATSWEQVASGDPAVSTFVVQTVPSAPAGATGNAVIPAGTTLQRQTAPAVTVGQLRYNTTDNEFEGYGGSPAAWGPLGGVPTGAGGDKIFFLNSQNVTADYTLPTAPLAKNSVSAGPITVAVGVTVTVPAASVIVPVLPVVPVAQPELELASRVASWAEVLKASVDPSIVTDVQLADKINATGLPWRVYDRVTGIEMKREGATQRALSEAQRDWLAWLSGLGHGSIVGFGAVDALDKIKKGGW